MRQQRGGSVIKRHGIDRTRAVRAVEPRRGITCALFDQRQTLGHANHDKVRFGRIGHQGLDAR